MAGKRYVYSPYEFKNRCNERSDAFATDHTITVHVLSTLYQSSVLLLISDSCSVYIFLAYRENGTTFLGKCSML